MYKKIVFYSVLVMLIILVNLTTVSSRNAGLIVYDKPANDIPIESFMRSWETMSVIKATVVSDVDSRLVIDVDYLYSGDHGDLVTTCGGISFEGTRGDWSCKPSGVKKGRGMATLSFGLSSIAKEIECSTDFTFSIYDNKGIVFADYKIPYEKVWYKNKVGLFGSLSKLISFCPKYSN